MPRPGMRITVGFGIAHRRRVGALAARRSRPRSPAGTARARRASAAFSALDVAARGIPVRRSSGLIFVRRKWSGHDVPSSASRGASWLFTKRSIRSSSWTVAITRLLPRRPGRAARAGSGPGRRRRSASGSAGYLRPAERLLALVARSRCTRAARSMSSSVSLVAGLVVVGPVDQAVLAQQDALRLRVLLDEPLDDQAEVEARPLPRRRRRRRRRRSRGSAAPVDATRPSR